MDEVIKKTVEARKAGLSYGKYVALEREKAAQLNGTDYGEEVLRQYKNGPPKREQKVAKKRSTENYGRNKPCPVKCVWADGRVAYFQSISEATRFTYVSGTVIRKILAGERNPEYEGMTFSKQTEEGK